MAAKRTRVLFFAIGSATDPAANIWVDVAPGVNGQTLVTLIYVYPDFHPGVGWHVEMPNGSRLEIDTVEGQNLICTEIPTP